MRPGLLPLLGAIVVEVIATSSLKASAGFTRLVPSVVVVLGYATAFYLLSLSLRAMPVSVAYAIWSGLGTMGVVAVGVLLFREPLTALRLAGTALVVAGVVLLNLGSDR